MTILAYQTRMIPPMLRQSRINDTRKEKCNTTLTQRPRKEDTDHARLLYVVIQYKLTLCKIVTTNSDAHVLKGDIRANRLLNWSYIHRERAVHRSPTSDSIISSLVASYTKSESNSSLLVDTLSQARTGQHAPISRQSKRSSKQHLASTLFLQLLSFKNMSEQPAVLTRSISIVMNQTAGVDHDHVERS